MVQEMSMIFYYCQHVLGIGHLFRGLEICKALNRHDVLLITGAPHGKIPEIPHVREFKLPGLMMDHEFKSLQSAEAGVSVDEIKITRKKLLLDLFEKQPPDFLMIELYPFGRNAFRFELLPVLKNISSNGMKTRVICSLRDILVEKQDPQAYENRVIGILNSHFHALLVHSDPNVISLSRSFGKLNEISIPVVYTGFVTPKPVPGSGAVLRKNLGIGKDEILIIASAGGGKVGFELLESVILAIKIIESGNHVHVYIFTGPLMDDDDFQRLETLGATSAKVFRFTDEFPSYLAAADLSISMAGYNTFMNILASDVQALVLPFNQNREQRLRADELSRFGDIHILDEEHLIPTRLAHIITRTIETRKQGRAFEIDLNGAENTATWLESWYRKGQETR